MIKDKISNWVLFSIGITVLSLGISLTLKAQIVGVSSWDSFHLGLTYYLPFYFGQITQGVGAIAILIGFFLGVKPKLGTVINMLFIGWMINFFLGLSVMRPLEHFSFLAFFIYMLGVALCGIGSGLYISADKGIGPRDSIMVGLNRKFGIRVGFARTFLEISVVILGFILGGPIGVGTIIFSLTVGFIIEKTMLVVKKVQNLKVIESDPVTEEPDMHKEEPASV